MMLSKKLVPGPDLHMPRIPTPPQSSGGGNQLVSLHFQGLMKLMTSEASWGMGGSPYLAEALLDWTFHIESHKAKPSAQNQDR